MVSAAARRSTRTEVRAVAAELPGLAERPGLELERPRGPRLRGEERGRRGDVVGRHEELVGLVLQPLTRAGEVDDAVDDDERDVDALRPQAARERLGERA